MRTALTAVAIVLIAAGAASATTNATLTGSVDGTYWYVWASVTGTPDNDGLQCATFKVSGVTESTEANVSPRTIDFGGPMGNVALGTYGFNQITSSYVIGPNMIEIISGMDPALAGTKYDLRHLGQQSVTFTSGQFGKLNGKPPVWNTIDPMVLIAKGTYDNSTGIPGFTESPAVNAWYTGLNSCYQVLDPENPDDWRSVIHYANVNSSDQFLPEPATLALLAMGGATVAVRRRGRRGRTIY